jgi:YVTN family beta-propeller protein
VLQTITLPGDFATRPMGGVAAPDGKHVFITTGRGKSVMVIDTATNAVVNTIEVGERPWGIAVSADGSQVFTANGPSNDVSFVDVAGKTVTARVKAGERPWGVAFVP